MNFASPEFIRLVIVITAILFAARYLEGVTGCDAGHSKITSVYWTFNGGW
jgi:hypothetical protein